MTQIFAKISTGGKEPPVLLIHELGQSHRTFRMLVEELSDFRTIAIDLPGSGASASLPEASGLGDYADAIGDWLEAEIKRPVIIVGIAIGGGIGAIIAARRPKSVAGLIYCCMGPAIEAHTRQFLEERCELVRRDGLPSTITMSLNNSFPEPVRPGREKAFEEYGRELSQARVDGYLNQSLALAKSGSTIGDNLQQVRAPVAVVAGTHDRHFTPDVLKKIDSLVFDLRERVVIDDAAHLPHVQSPARLAKIVRDFAVNISKNK